MASLPRPYLTDMVRGCEPLTPVLTYKGASSLRRLYEDVAMPERLLVMGDAACCFNPLYGQGISVAVAEAAALGRLLDQRSRDAAAAAAAASGAVATAGGVVESKTSETAMPQAALDGLSDVSYTTAACCAPSFRCSCLPACLLPDYRKHKTDGNGSTF